MLFDNFDKKIKEAAEQHHPAYDENAWRKMENLLEEHLPRQNSRRRFFLLAFTVLLIGGGAYVFLSNPHTKNSDLTVQKNVGSPNGQTRDKTNKDETIVLPGIDNTSREIATDHPAPQATTKIVDKEGNALSVIDQKIFTTRQSRQRVEGNQLTVNTKTVDDRNNSILVNQDKQKNDETLKMPVTFRPEETSSDKPAVNNPVVNQNQVTNNTQPLQSSSTTKTTPKKGRPGLLNGLSFFVSAGPDVSKAQNSKAGKVTMSWGLGVAYSLNRFTLKTGVFSTNKIYWAGPNDYELSYTPPASLKFMGADANCRVIEIPVKLSYNFAVKDRSNWFAGAGLSSYLMKREDYLYEYKSNTTGNSYYHSYETKNENKHYFSIMNLSGGYTYRLNKTISLSAEPYVELPLTGIGAGKVHLKSGGVLFTVGVSPFRK